MGQPHIRNFVYRPCRALNNIIVVGTKPSIVSHTSPGKTYPFQSQRHNCCCILLGHHYPPPSESSKSTPPPPPPVGFGRYTQPINGVYHCLVLRRSVPTCRQVFTSTNLSFTAPLIRPLRLPLLDADVQATDCNVPFAVHLSSVYGRQTTRQPLSSIVCHPPPARVRHHPYHMFADRVVPSAG